MPDLHLKFVLITSTEVENPIKSLEKGQRGGDTNVELKREQDLNLTGDERLLRDMADAFLSL